MNKTSESQVTVAMPRAWADAFVLAARSPLGAVLPRLLTLAAAEAELAAQAPDVADREVLVMAKSKLVRTR